MPKVGGNTIPQCMDICMSDPVTKQEYPDTEKRREVCYAACMQRLDNTPLEQLGQSDDDSEEE
jgi:hypothetical protein